jgi:BarA-like signal transduction histidine kinase
LKAAGASGCLTKPLNVKEVLELIDLLLADDPTVGDDA